MKKLILGLLCSAIIPAAFAQGSFTAANTPDGVTPGPQGAVYLNTVGGPLAGTEFSVSLWWGLVGQDASQFTMANLTADFGGGPAVGSILSDGLFYIGQVDLYPGTTGPAQVLIQLRGSGPNVNEALSRSAIVTQSIAYGTDFPPDLANTGAWAIVVPEPSSFALMGLGSMALFAFRRRK